MDYNNNNNYSYLGNLKNNFNADTIADNLYSAGANVANGIGNLTNRINTTFGDNNALNQTTAPITTLPTEAYSYPNTTNTQSLNAPIDIKTLSTNATPTATAPVAVTPDGSAVSNQLNFSEDKFNALQTEFDDFKNQGPSLLDNIGTGADIGIGLFNAYNGYQATQTAQDSLDFSKEAFNKNYDQQLASYNRQVERQDAKDASARGE